MAERAFALLIDDGELDGVAELIEALGIQHQRLLHGAEQEGWRRPSRLLVVSGRRALCLPLPMSEEDGANDYKKIAVVDRASKTLRAQIERMGFDAVVYRPVDPEALQIMLAAALHTGREHRAQPRYAVGATVGWHAGLRRRSGTLTEISSRGCRLLVQVRKAPRALSLKLPAHLAGGLELRLPGRVLRSRTREDGQRTLTIVFDTLDAVQRERLGILLQGLAGGPTSLAA